MTRAQFIQRIVSSAVPLHGPDHVVREAISLADVLEKSGAAPWDVARDDLTSVLESRGTSDLLADAIKSEREACAKIAEQVAARQALDVAAAAARNVGAAIRAREAL